MPNRIPEFVTVAIGLLVMVIGLTWCVIRAGMSIFGEMTFFETPGWIALAIWFVGGSILGCGWVWLNRAEDSPEGTGC